MTTAHNNLGELDEALITGARALEIAGRLGDLRLRLVTTTYLEQAHFFRGGYDRVIELATENLAALPTDWIYESFGNVAPASVYDRCWLVHTLAHLGRFPEATVFEADAIRLAQTTQHANTVGMVHYARGCALPPQGRLGEGPLTDRARARGLPGRARLDGSANRSRLVGVGAGATR